MAIKFLSGLNLSDVTAGSILKLDSNGNIVAATAGTDYLASSLWTASGSNIYYSSGNVTIGTSSNSAPLHVYGYQTTDPKILIEDGNTGDASMQFKISTQSYIMGIDNSDSDRFKITAGTSFGTTGIEIDSSHKIGIAGTPTSRLHLYGHGANDGEIRIDSGGDNTEFGIFRFIGDSSTYEKYLIGYNSAHTSQAHEISLKNTGGDITFYTGTNGSAAEKVRITSGGNVGIGVSAPPTDLSLGDGTHTSPDDTNRILNWYSATGGDEITNSSHYITVGQSSSDTTQPKSVGLALFNQNTANNTYSPAITFGGLSTSGDYMNGAAAIAAQLIANTNDNNFRSGELTFYTQGSTTATRGLVERMRITSTGNVGIGTTSPSEKVEIYGNATYYSAKNTSGNVIARLGADSSGDGNFELFQSADTNNRKVKLYAETGAANYINNGGKFGIGTASPNGRVTVFDDMISSSSTTTDIAVSKTSYGSINFQGANQEAGASNTKQQAITWQVNDYGSSNIDYGVQAAIAVSNNGSVGTQMGFFTSNSYSGGPSERIRITAAGLVGISNSNPSRKLDVAGTFRATGVITASSDIVSDGGGILKFIAGSNHVSGLTVYNSAQNGYLSNRITTDAHSRGWGWEFTTTEANSSSGNVYFRVGYNGTVSYLNSGNFGIGTTNPGSLLSIRATTASHQLVRINRPNSDTAALYLGNNSSNDAIISGNNAPISLGKDVSGTYTEYVNIATDGELKFSAYGAGILKTNASGIVSLDTNTYLTSVDVDWNDIDSINGTININSTTQIGQGDTETLVSFQNSGTERGRFEVDDSANSYFVATGFKTTSSSTGLLKSDGTIDTSTYATTADINSFIEITDVATYLSTNNYITSSYTGFDSRYYTETEANDRFVSFENYNRAVPAAGGWYKLVKLSRGAVRIGISYTGGNMSPHTYIVEAFKDWSSTATLNVQKYGEAAYISEFRIIKESGGGNSDYYLEAYFTSLTNAHSFECYFQEILGYRSVSEIFAVSSGNTLNATNSGTNTPIEALVVGSNEGLYTRNLDVNGRLYLDTLDTNTTSTSALVLGSSSEIEKRTLGSNAFTSTTYAPLASPGLTGTPTAPTAAAGTNTTQIATTAFVSTAVSNLVDSAPATLDTLNELAAALGDDANFSTTVTNSIATKVSKSGDTMTGALEIELSTSSPLLNLYNTSNGSGAAIQFSDQTSQSQLGDITFRHTDGQSQGGGTSFHFTSNQPDVVLVVGDTTNKGRFVAWSNNNVNEVDYGFADDVNTGMVQTSADNVSLVAGGVRGVGVGSTAVSLKYAGTTKLATSTSGIDVTGVLDVSSRVKAGGQISVNNRTAMSVLHWSSSGSSTGAIKITLPGSHSSNWSMIVLRITAYEYNSTAHTVYYVSGHDWTSGWYNNGVTKIGNGNKDIQLAYDSNKDYVILGGTASTWSYGHVTVDVMAHPSFYSSNMDISSGWAITQTTDLSGITTQAVTNKRVLTTSDEGSGNGIDADTVDGLQASSFLRSDASDTMTGALTMSAGTTTVPLSISGSSHKYIDIATSSNNQVGIRMSDDNTNFIVGLHGGEDSFKVSAHTSFGTNDYLTIKSDGKVGIGTSSPNAQLQIDTPAANQAGQGLRLNRPSEGTNYHSVEFATNGTVDWSVGQNSNDAFEVYENGAAATTRFTIKEGGKVGIGTTSPSRFLTVSESGAANGSQNITAQFGNVTVGATSSAIYIGAYTGTDWLIGKNIYGTSSHYNFEIGNQASGSSPAISINNSNNVGIGTTSPGGKLHLEGDFESGKALVIKGTYGTDTEYYFRTHGTNSEYLALYAAGTRIMNFNSGIVDTYKGLRLFGGAISTGTSNHLVIGSSVQIGQGDEDPVIEFKYGTTSLGKIDQFGDIHAGGFKVSGTTGFLKSDGSVDTSTYASSTHNHDSSYVLSTGGYYDEDFTWDGTHDFSNVIKVSGAAATTTNTTALFYGTNGVIEKRSLGSAAFSDSTDFAAASHTHSYLPLAGGTLTGDLLIDTGTTGSTTQAYSAFDSLQFNNQYSSVAAGPNKIVMYDDGGSWVGGFGIHDDTTAYYSGGTHKWYKTASGPGGPTFTQKMSLDSSGNLAVTGTLTATGGTLSGALTLSSGDLTVPGYIRHNGDTDTYIVFTNNRVQIVAGNVTKFDSNTIYTGTVQSVSGAGTVSGLTLTSDDDSVDPTLTLGGSITTPVSGDWWNNGFAKVGTDGVMEIGKYIDFHDTDTETDDFSYRITASNTALTFSGALNVPEFIYHNGDSNTYVWLTADRIRLVAGGTTKIDTSNTYLLQSTNISVRNITARDIVSESDRTYSLGTDANRWAVVFCETLDSAGQHESKLQNPEGETPISEYETGTVLVWKGGKNVPCTKAADHMRMGIAVKGIESPLVQGAEPVLCTGEVKEGDYLVTSTTEGHAEAISPEFMRQHMLFDCVIGKALEDGAGESHLVKTWINI